MLRGLEELKKLVNKPDLEGFTPLVSCLLSHASFTGPSLADSWTRGQDCLRKLLLYGADAAAAFVTLPAVTDDTHTLEALLLHQHLSIHGDLVVHAVQGETVASILNVIPPLTRTSEPPTSTVRVGGREVGGGEERERERLAGIAPDKSIQ